MSTIFRIAEDAAWMITEESLRLILEIAARENLESPEALSARLGRPLDNTRVMTMRGNVALLPIDGPIFPKANLFSDISGATSLQTLAHDFVKAGDSAAVDAILLSIEDSPGGTVEGVNEFAAMIGAMREKKPVWAYVARSAASATYWIASACDRVIVEETAHVGSIGVVLTMRKPGDAASAKNVEFVSSISPNKRPDISTEPGRAHVQAYVDALGGIFVEAVARQRKITPEAVVAIGGAVLIGKAAVKAGLADSVGTLESTIEELSTSARGKGFEAAQKASAKENAMKFGETALGKKLLAIFGEEVTASDLPPEPKAQTADPEEVKKLKAKLLEASQPSFETAAKAFAEGLLAGNKAFPFEAKMIEGDYIRAAQDDLLSPVAAGASTRVEGLVARYKAVKAHALTDERVPDPATTTLPNDPDSESLAKLEAETKEWGKSQNKQ